VKKLKGGVDEFKEDYDVIDVIIYREKP